MIRRNLRKLLGRTEPTILPLDMFDHARTEREASTARRLEGIYHKGQKRVWSGKDVLPELIEKHGGIQLPEAQRESLAKVFAVILWGELAAWKISADLAFHLPDMEAKMAATSQAHDEARHFYTMYDYLDELIEVPTTLGPATRRTLEGTLQANTLVKKLIGMQLMIEPMALTLFQQVRRSRLEPVLCDLLELYERDEARHVALGVLHLPALLKGMNPVQAADLWAWDFRELSAQFAMLRELEPDLLAIGMDPAEMARVARDKQVRANLMLMDELGYDLPVKQAFLHYFQAKIEWNFPKQGRDRSVVDRLRTTAMAGWHGVGSVDEKLSYVPA